MRAQSCRYCGKTFTGKVKWQQYCSERCRYQYWEESNPRQKVEASLGACYYCGATANTVDNVPPVSIRPRIVSLKLESKYPFREVWACRECNCALSDRAFWTLPERKRYIKKWLQRRYRRYLRIPNWGESELLKMGDTLRSSVLAGILIRDIVRNRLKW